MWFSENSSNLLGAFLGAAVGILSGCFGAFIGIFVPKGKFKRLVLSVFIFFIISGIIFLLVGIYALLSGQPFHVWIWFILIGVILSFGDIPLWFIVRNKYKMLELNKMIIKDVD